MSVPHSTVFIRVVQVIQGEGWKAFCHTFAAAFQRRWLGLVSLIHSVREVTEIELNLDDFNPRFAPRSDMQVERVSESLLDQRAPELPKDWADLLRDLLAKRCISFWILSGECVVGLICFAVNRFHVKDMGLRVRLAKEEVLLYGIFVEVSHRGKITSGVLIEKAMLYFKERDYNRVMAHIDLRNIPSLRYAKKNGFYEVKRWRVRKIFGIPWAYETKATGNVLNVPRSNRIGRA